MGRANFNVQTERHQKTLFLDNIFCRECKTPVFANTFDHHHAEDRCPKCDRDLTEVVPKAKALQEKLRKEHERNKSYVPPERYV